MSCDPELRASSLTPIQLLVEGASEELKKHRTDIKEAFKLINSTLTILIIHTSTSTSTADIESHELEAKTLTTRLETLLSSHKTDIDKFPVAVVIDLFIASGTPTNKAKKWAQKEVRYFEKQYKVWEGRLKILRKACDAGDGKSGFWIALREKLVQTYGEEKVLKAHTWA